LIFFSQNTERPEFTELLNPTDLRGVLQQTSDEDSPPVQIPTGVLLEEIRFTRHDEVTLSGLVWQVANPHIPDDSLGVVFSRSQLDKTRMEKVFANHRQGNVVYGWRFSTTRPYLSNVGKYPFDKGLISLQIAPTDRKTNLLLVPDFRAYDLMIPEALPGVDPGLTLKYWNLHSTYFSKPLVKHSRTIERFSQRISLSDQQLNSELYFNVSLTRKWLSPIVSYILPVFIGSIMIFIVLMIPNDRSSGVVFSTLSYGSTIYFVISIFHVGLRNSEGIDGLTYLESYYIIMHAMVMLVSMNGLLLMLNKGPRWIFFKENIVPRMLYWPMITSGLMIMTFLYFVLPSLLRSLGFNY
jgi:hypothetical protein